MELVRILTLNHYEEKDKRFSSLAFRNSSNNWGSGISVICVNCANEQSLGICEHIRRKYPKHTNPPIYWKFSATLLPASCRLELDNSYGDECHYNIFGLSDKEAKSIFSNNKLGNLYFCDRDNSISKTEIELTSLIDSKDII